MKRSTYCIIAMILVLAGCGSFNNSFNTYHFLPKTDAPGTLPGVTDLGSDDDLLTPGSTPSFHISDISVDCAVSPYPVTGKPPEIPTKELQAAAGDVYAIERIERKHINELRAYIMDRRKAQREAYQIFTEKCSTANKR